MHAFVYTQLTTLFRQSPLKAYGLLLIVMLLVFLSLSSCEYSSNHTTPITQWSLLKNCSLHQQACEAKQAGQSVRLQITPKPIKVARILTIEVTLQGIEAIKVELDIAGENMYMGYNRVQLTAVPDHPGLYHGQSMLAFCTLDDMNWQVSVLVTQPDDRLLAVPFALNTPKR